MSELGFLSGPELRDWVLGRRWFASKAREVAGLSAVEVIRLRDDAPRLVLAIVEVRFQPGTHETYQVPLGLRPADEGFKDGVITTDDGWTVYDALTDPLLARELLHRMRGLADVPTEEGTLRFRWAEEAPADARGPAEVRPMGVEQSNSSIVFGEELVLKVFRRLEPGVNPELELLRFLTERGFENIAPLAGWYEYEGRLMDVTLGVLQRFLAGARDGWELALEEIATNPSVFLSRVRNLGEVTGTMHTLLGSDAHDPAFAPEIPSVEAMSLLTATVDEQIERVFVDLDEDDARVAPIAGRGQDVRERLQQLTHIGTAGKLIRVHGDYHLGQTVLTDRGWVVLDFEGEPARPLPERRLKRSPLRDVAGMLRSFAYVASAAEIRHGVEPDEWEHLAREAFMDGYVETVDPNLLPPGQESTAKLLAVFELEKAVYELRYELNNRPDWVGIPVAGIARLLEVEV